MPMNPDKHMHKRRRLCLCFPSFMLIFFGEPAIKSFFGIMAHYLMEIIV